MTARRWLRKLMVKRVDPIQKTDGFHLTFYVYHWSVDNVVFTISAGDFYASPDAFLKAYFQATLAIPEPPPCPWKEIVEEVVSYLSERFKGYFAGIDAEYRKYFQPAWVCD